MRKWVWKKGGGPRNRRMDTVKEDLKEKDVTRRSSYRTEKNRSG